tara:strand:- start:4581 stop:5609 length:1029 start_codon:yes stop_codon:yes gene_type:complete
MINIKTNSLPTFNELVDFITEMPKIDQDAVNMAKDRDKRLLKPPGSLGELEEIVLWAAGWQGTYPPKIDNISVAIFVSNHGTAINHRISPYPTAVTGQLLKSWRSESAVINQICKTHNIGLQVFDLAVEEPTQDITIAPAMTSKDCITTILYGREAIASNPDIICLGEGGIGNTTIASAICAALYGGDLKDWVGPGTGADQNMIKKKIEVIEKSLNFHKSRLPLEVLRCFGGREFAGIVGAILAARFERVPVILDGFPVCAAAAILNEILPSSLDHCYVAHKSREPGHKKLLQKLGKKPLLDLQMSLGEGSGAALAVPLITSAINIHNNTSTFQDAEVQDRE